MQKRSMLQVMQGLEKGPLDYFNGAGTGQLLTFLTPELKQRLYTFTRALTCDL